MIVEITTDLDHWKLERCGEVFVAADVHGFEGESKPTVEAAFESLEQRLDTRRDELYRRLALSRVKRNRNPIHYTRGVGHPRFYRN
jgi:hypothetical protein